VYTLKYLASFTIKIIDKDITFSSHIKQLETKLAKSDGILRKVKPFLTAISLQQLYYAIFQSHL